MTSSPQFSRALCTEIGLAGAPFIVVNATQYEIAGQSDLFTFVKFPSSHCCVIELAISSLELFSFSVSSLMQPLFFSWLEIALKKMLRSGYLKYRKDKMRRNLALKMFFKISSETSVLQQILTWNCMIAWVACAANRCPRPGQGLIFNCTSTFGAYDATSSADNWR